MEQIEFIFESFESAMDIHERLFKILRETGVVTYADLYLMTSEDPDKCEKDYYKYGWYNLFYSKVEPYHCGKWVLKMPDLIKLENIKIIEKENE